MRIRPGIELAALTDVGCERENNEDRYSYWEAASDEQFRQKGRLAIVADGMGGYEGGQEASRIAIEVVENTYATSPGDPRSLLLEGFQAAHQRIQEQAAHNPEVHGMGTTCTAAALVENQLYYAHVGDSRLYLIRDSSISRLTQDHSYVSRLVESGVIRPEEAESHPQRHILTAALGAGAAVSPDSPERPLAVQAGDVLLLCSDGLWSLLPDKELEDAVQAESLDRACHEMIERAKRRGGPDNITVEVLRISKPSK